jgi:hypothetical protein
VPGGTLPGFEVGDTVGWIGAPVEEPPVGVAEAVALWPPWLADPEGNAVPYDVPTEVVTSPEDNSLKLAQAMRVLLDRWTTMDLSPK